MLMTDSGKIIRMPIEGISVISRNTQGVKLMGMAPDERMAGAARLAEQEEASCEGDEEENDSSEDVTGEGGGAGEEK
jgi:DNA gyrase subunit A